MGFALGGHMFNNAVQQAHPVRHGDLMLVACLMAFTASGTLLAQAVDDDKHRTRVFSVAAATSLVALVEAGIYGLIANSVEPPRTLVNWLSGILWLLSGIAGGACNHLRAGLDP